MFKPIKKAQETQTSNAVVLCAASVINLQEKILSGLTAGGCWGGDNAWGSKKSSRTETTNQEY